MDMLNWVSTRTHRYFSARLLSSWVAPGVSCCPIPPQVQDLLLLLDELRKVPGSTFFQLVLVTLDGSMTCWCISHSFQFYSISKLAEGTSPT